MRPPEKAYRKSSLRSSAALRLSDYAQYYAYPVHRCRWTHCYGQTAKTPQPLESEQPVATCNNRYAHR
jgi:GH24 family phage-related lysozyme (muramidase)